MASQIATGIRKTVAVSTTQATTKIAIAPRSGRMRRQASRYALTAPDRSPRVDLDERARRRGLHEGEPEQRERRPDDGREERPAPRRLTRDRADEVDDLQQEPLEERDHERDRDEQHAEAEEEPRSLDVHARRRGEDLTPRAAPGDPCRRDRRPGRPHRGEDHEPEDRREEDERRHRVPQEPG